jgi:fructosamine-3-kinase
MWTEIAEQISHACGERFEIAERRSVGGGCINEAYILSEGKGQHYFVKINQAAGLDMFSAEAWGLREMGAVGAIVVPHPLCWGIAGERAFLVLSYLDLEGRGRSQNWQQMGAQLAQMHDYPIGLDSRIWDGTTPVRQYGWHINNTIGSTPQINTWETDWGTFWRDRRIGYQLHLARRRGGNISQGDALLAAIPKLLENYHPQPSLVHGDLWSGNASFTRDGIPVIFDPATYWGDREVDIAMTELFGGFPGAFYQGYNSIYPIASGYERRKPLYNLYHLLNHYNLFGGSYLNQVNSTIEQLLRVVG